MKIVITEPQFNILSEMIKLDISIGDTLLGGKFKNKKLQNEINKIKKHMGLTLNENRKHKYGCVMIFFDFPEIKEIHDVISEDDIYIDPNDDSFGLENDPHTTLLFGLHDNVTTEKVKKIVSNFKFADCKIYNPSLFENDKYDVLKFDVKGKGLIECNDKLTKLPHTTDYPEYHPHLTIGYLKPSTGKIYTKKLKNLEYKLTPQYVIYSKPDGSRDKIEIN